MSRFFLVLTLLIATQSILAYDGQGCRESDHIICRQFDQWTVRHYFDIDSLQHRFSDANTTLHLVDENGEKYQIDFQINVNSEGEATLRIPGWITSMHLIADEFKYEWTGKQTLHEFIQPADPSLLNAIADSNSKITVQLTFDQPPGIKEMIESDDGRSSHSYSGTIENRESARSLIWIRAIRRRK